MSLDSDKESTVLELLCSNFSVLFDCLIVDSENAALNDVHYTRQARQNCEIELPVVREMELPVYREIRLPVYREMELSLCKWEALIAFPAAVF